MTHITNNTVLTELSKYIDVSNIDHIDTQYLSNFVRMLNTSNGNIDYRIYFKLLSNKFKPLEINQLTSRLYILHYKNEIDILNAVTTEEQLKDTLLRSINYVVYYCIENNIKSLEEYLDKDRDIIPIVARHLNCGGIYVTFLACIDNIDDIISSYPPDVSETYFRIFKQKHNKLLNLIQFSYYRKYLENFSNIINNIINDKREHIHES